MADFRTKLLGLTGIVLAFAGVASAQSNCNPGVTGVTAPYALTVPTLRAEGTTELVGDITFTCPSSLNSSSLLTVTLNGTTTITSKTGVNNSTSEVALVVNGGAAVYGTVSGSQVSFTYTPPAGGFTAQIENIRVNASTLPTGNVPVTANVVANTGSISLVQQNVIVGYAATSLKAPVLTKSVTGGSPNPKTVVACVGNINTSANGGLSFAFDIAEAFPGAFKDESDETGTDASATPAGAGTRFAVTISGIPSTATAYLPELIASTSGLTLQAITSPTVADGAGGTTTGNQPTAATGTSFPGAAGTPVYPFGTPVAPALPLDTYTGFFALPSSGTAYYEVIAPSTPTASESASVPVFLYAAAGKITAASSISVVLGYAQTGLIPNFVATTLAPVSGSQIGLCNTTLLFPYVTTLAGYETGIAITNTSTDPFGTNGASAQAGTCSLSFYGTSNLTTAYTTPTTPILAPVGTTSGASNSIPSGQTAGFAVSTLAGGPGVNFDGYMIAQCAFQYGHGFAYLLSNPSTPTSSTAMGYLALVLQDPAEVTGGRSAGLAPSETLGN